MSGLLRDGLLARSPAGEDSRPDEHVGADVEGDLEQAAPSVAPAAVHDDAVDELRSGSQHHALHVAERRGRGRDVGALEGGIAPHVGERLAQRSGELVLEVALEDQRSRAQLEALVHPARLVVAVGASPEQPRAIGGVLRRRPQQAAEEAVPQGEHGHVGAGGGRCQKREDALAQRCRHALVGIDLEHPVPARGVQRDVALDGETRPRVLDHPRPGGEGELGGAVARAAVDDDHLVAERDALERRRQALLLVLHDQARGKALAGHGRR